jgi:hypothetical protein
VLGTILNTATVIAGSAIGVGFGRAMSEKTSRTILAALGAGTIVYGVTMGMKTANMLVPIMGLAIGTAVGCALKLDERMETLAERLQKRVSGGAGRRGVDEKSADDASSIEATAGEHANVDDPASSTGGAVAKSAKERFIEGFTTASVLYCVGPMTILGSIEDGLGVSYRILALKSLLDGIASIAFASALGVGVAFSAVSVFVVQGAITLAAGLLAPIFTDALIAELTACGGYILVLIGLGLTGATKVKSINTLPALVVTPAVVALLDHFGVGWRV